MEVVEALAMVGGLVDEETVIGNEYPPAEKGNQQERNHQFQQKRLIK